MFKFISGLVLVCALGLIPSLVQAQQGKPPAGQEVVNDQVSKIQELLKSHKDPKVRSAAAFALGQLGARAKGSLEALILACGDDSPEVQAAAKVAIGQIASGQSGSNTASNTNNTNNKPNPPTVPVAPKDGKYTIKLVSDPKGVKPEGYHTQKVEFKAGAKISIQVKSDADTNINLYVDDPSGKQVASDTSKGKDCSAELTITEAGTYSIVIDNLGPNDTQCTVTYSAK